MEHINERFFDEDDTPRRCGINDDAPRPSQRELRRIVLDRTRDEFPSCYDIFSGEGVSKEQLEHAIHCISFFLKHNTEKRTTNGNNMYFVCSTSDTPRKPSKRKPRTASPDCSDAQENHGDGIYPDARCRNLGSEAGNDIIHSDVACSFYLHFCRRGELWFFKESDRLTSISITCAEYPWPPICTRSKFLEFYVDDWLQKSSLVVDDIDTAMA